MSKKEEKFPVGAHVFAKIKGYAPWPAKIERVDKKRYFVKFYGTGEKSPAMKVEDLFEYTKHKAQYVVDKNLKRKFYKEAVEQIESALRGEEDVASINNTSAMDESLNATEDGAELKSQLDDSEVVKQDDEKETSSPITTVVPDSKAVETPVAVKVDTKPSKKSLQKVASPEPKPVKQEVETSEPEITSRSGRKIKTKRYLIDEVDETVTPTIKKRAVESERAAKPVAVPVNEEPNPEKDALLQIESHLIELDHLIKASVGLKNANADKCLEHLKEYQTLKITPLMLKKRPGVVQTMKRLRKYVGNAINWEMDDSMKDEFKEKALKIQLKAEEIYGSFKLLFPHHEQKSFWDHFSDKVAEFQSKTKGWTPDELNSLYEEPPSPPTSPIHLHRDSDIMQNNNGTTD